MPYSIKKSSNGNYEVLSWKDFKKKFAINSISILKINIEGSEWDLIDCFDDEDFYEIDQICVSFHYWLPEFQRDGVLRTKMNINKIINTNRRLDLLTDQLSIVEEVQAAAPVTPVVNPLSNTNPIVNSKIAPSTVTQLGAAGTNTSLTQPLKVEDVFKTGIV